MSRAITCNPCAPGTAQPNLGASSCPDCSPGTYQSSPGTTACINCAPDTYSDAGADTCSACPPPQTSPTDCHQEVCSGNSVVSIDDDTETSSPDGVSCTVDQCSSGSPSYVPDDSLCDDHDPCTQDTCNPSTDCVHTPISGCVADAGSDPDAGTDAGVDGGSSPPQPPRGCGCSSTPDGLLFAAAATLLIAVSRRRRPKGPSANARL